MLITSKLALPHGPELEVLHGGTGPPLVWLHGVRHARPDDVLLAALAGSFQVFAPILPGKVSLDELDALPTLHDLVLFYDSALEALGLSRVLLAGHGFGGLIAAELAALAPPRVRGLVLVSPLGLWNDAYPVADLFARSSGEIDPFLWSGAASAPPAATAEADPVEAGIALAHALGGIARYTWPIPDRGLRGRLYRIAAPTLLMFAEADALVPAAYARDFADGLADSRAQLLKGGHMAVYEDPSAAAAVIAAFTAELAAPA